MGSILQSGARDQSVLSVSLRKGSDLFHVAVGSCNRRKSHTARIPLSGRVLVFGTAGAFRLNCVYPVNRILGKLSIRPSMDPVKAI